MGPVVSAAIPDTSRKDRSTEPTEPSVWQNLARIDYAGALTLVRKDYSLITKYNGFL